MPLFKCSASKAKPKNGIRYITDPKKAAFVSAKNLFEDEDYAKQFEETAKRFGKGEKFDERKYYHFKLSCARKDNVTPEKAHAYAEEVAEAFFKNYECVIATHTDTETVHSHIIVNAVDPITGKKLQFGKAEYAAMKDEVNRIGKEHGETDKIYGELKEISQLENISLEGIFTHYAVADSLREQDEKYTKAQTEKILAVADKCEAEGLHLDKVHFLNSAGGVYYYNERSSLARLGIILYGLYPDPAKALPFEPKPAMEFKAAVAQVKYIDNGTDVSYGRTYTANGKVKLATVTAGYADGYPRALSNKGYVLINGKKCPITGRICMDQFMCDVTEVEDVKAGDEAVLIGAQGNEKITADDIGKMTGTIGYEIVCGISARVPRVISRHGEQTAVLEIE